MARGGDDGLDCGTYQDTREYRLHHGDKKYHVDDEQNDMASRKSRHGYQTGYLGEAFSRGTRDMLAEGDVRHSDNSAPMRLTEIKDKAAEEEEELAERLGDPVHGFRKPDMTEVNDEVADKKKFSSFNTPDLGEASGLYDAGLHRDKWRAAAPKRADPYVQRKDGLVGSDFAREAWQVNGARLDMEKMYIGSGLDKYAASARELPVSY